MGTSYETLIQAKKDNVALQLEAAYRERLQDAYQQVSRALAYLFRVQNLDLLGSYAVKEFERNGA
jgi:hypothetical protein